MKPPILRKSSKYLFFWFTGIFLWVGLFGITSAKDLKVGFFDMNYLKNELPFFQKLANVKKAKDAELETFRGNLYRDYLKYYQENTERYNKEKQGKSSAEQAQITARFQTELNSKIKEMNDQIDKKRIQIEAYKAEQSQNADNKMMELINMISGKKKFDIVIQKELVYYGGTDITQDIIKQAKKDEQTDNTK